MKVKKVGRLPVNSRITIDYSKEKPTIKFGYPNKDVGQNSGTIYSLLTIFLVVAIFIGFYYIVSYNLSDELPIPTDCNAENIYYSFQNHTSLAGFNITCDNGWTQYFEFVNGRKSKYYIINEFLKGSSQSPTYIIDFNIWITISYLFIVLLIGKIIYFIFWKLDKWLMRNIWMKLPWISKSVPYVNKAISDNRYYYCFKEVPADKLYVELPMFKNIKLNYIAKGEFSKYLLRMEIREHPFSMKVFKEKNKRRIKNVYLWYARWYFKEVPKSGKLEIFFT